VPTPARELCALLHEGHVLTDATRRVPSYDEGQRHTPLEERARKAGDASAVLTAPQLQIQDDPMVLLSVFTPRGDPVDGAWTPLADLAEQDAVVTALRSVAAVMSGETEAPARRPNWFRTGWYDEVEAWVDDQLAARGRSRGGPAQPVNVWSLSAVVRVPCDPAPPVWVKGSCRHFHAEPALTRLVAEMLPIHAPPLIATDDERGWTLMEDIPGVDYEDQDTPPPVGAQAARAIAALQLRSLEHLTEIEASGVPVRDLTTTMHQFDQVLGESVELGQLTAGELEAARGTRHDVHRVLAELAGLGIPDTLVHGDLHTGNLAQGADTLVLYDWSDAAVSHPFLDLVLLCERLSQEEQESARTTYAAAWRAAYPEADVSRALELAVQANAIYQMVTYEQLYAAGEDASYWEMSGVVGRMLRNLPERFPRGR
jgi:aminoglycoside phosphotransferase (APT) family kinase protein